MKKIIIFFLLNTILFYSQETSVTINYKCNLPKINEIDSTKTNPKVYKDLMEMAKSVSNLEFELVSNSKRTKFYLKNKLEQDSSNGLKLAKKIYGMFEYFYEKSEKIKYKKINNLLIRVDDTINWNLTNETKLINNFTCYKATFEYNFTNRNGAQSKRDIMAWYCPEINITAAPESYNGLPGLIMELNTGLIVYILQDIYFHGNEIEIILPKNKIITETEYINQLKENNLINQK